MAKNILICDDAAFMRMMIKDILTKNGYNIAGEAENGQKAVEKYAELKPDLVLMDITMPEMDGIEALKRIKAADPSASVIMCSAMGQQAMVIEAIQAGAKDFIVKPFQAERVLEAVKKDPLYPTNYMISYNPQLGSALYKWDYEAEMRLKERHPEYKKFLEEYISIQKSYDNLQCEISKLELLRKELEHYRNTIYKYFVYAHRCDELIA